MGSRLTRWVYLFSVCPEWTFSGLWCFDYCCSSRHAWSPQRSKEAGERGSCHINAGAGIASSKERKWARGRNDLNMMSSITLSAWTLGSLIIIFQPRKEGQGARSLLIFDQNTMNLLTHGFRLFSESIIITIIIIKIIIIKIIIHIYLQTTTLYKHCVLRIWKRK